LTDQLRVGNHWIAESYFAPFTDGGQRDGLLHVYSRDDPQHPRRLAPEVVAKEKYLYVIRVPGQPPDDGLERMLGDHVEGPFMLMRNKLVYGPEVGIYPVLDGKERAQLAMYLAFQQMRTPYMRDVITWFSSFARTAWTGAQLSDPRRAQREIEEESGRAISLEEIERMRDGFQSGGLVMVPPENYWLSHAMELAQPISCEIAQLPLRVVRMHAGVRLPTCDTPLVLAAMGDAPDQYVLGGGWAGERTEALFPLSPTLALVLTRNPDRDRVIGSVEWCRSARRRIVEGAQRWVYCSEAAPDVPKLLRRSKPPSVGVEFGGARYLTRDNDVASVVGELFRRDTGLETIRFGHVA
jgi:hypothetical protein